MKKSVLTLLSIGVMCILSMSCSKEETGSVNKVQLQYSMGALLLSPLEYAAVPQAEMPEYKKPLPAAWLIPYLPPVGSQVGEGSCTAWGSTYAGRSISWAIKKGQTSYSQSLNIFSPEYVFNQVRLDSVNCGGAYMTTVFNLLKTQGVCRWSVMPYETTTCSLLPNAAQRADAAGFKIYSYGTVPVTVSSLKTNLASNIPVVVCGPVDNNFYYLPANGVLTARTGYIGAHCYCLVGYDNSKNAFKFMNSWGTTWSSAGFGWIDYNYLNHWISEAYTMTTK